MEGSLVPMRRGRSGSKNSSSGIRIHQATMPPATLMEASCGPMMYPIPIRAGERLGVDHGIPPKWVTLPMGCFSIIEVLDDGFRKRQKTFRVFAKNLQAVLGLQNLDQAAETHRSEDVARGSGGAGFAGLHDLVTGDALGPRQRRIDAQRAAQHNDEEDADQSADQEHQCGLPIMGSQIGPKALAVQLHHHECRDGEDCAGDQSFADRGRGARDVLFQRCRPKRGDTEEAMAITAAGMVAATVWPARIPR